MPKSEITKPKYYYAADANMQIEHGGIGFNFRRVQFQNCVWSGIYTTDDPKKQEALTEFMKKNQAVCEVPKEFYDSELANMDDSAMRPVDKTPSKAIPDQILEANIVPDGIDNVNLEITDAPIEPEQKKKPRKPRSASKSITPPDEGKSFTSETSTDLEIDDL